MAVPFHYRFCLHHVSRTLEQKVQIVNNAVDSCHSIGIENPKVAAVCAVEVVNPDMPPTLDAAELTKMNEKGEIAGCTLYLTSLPLTTQWTLRLQSIRRLKEVAGNADIFLMPNIETQETEFINPSPS